MAEKMTKMAWFDVLAQAVTESTSMSEEVKTGALDFVEHQKDMLEAKAEKAKERAAKVKAAGDELRSAVLAVVTDEEQTIDQITEQVEGEEITRAKVTARLSQLFKAGLVEKTTVKEGSRRITAYKLNAEGPVDFAEDAE